MRLQIIEQRERDGQEIQHLRFQIWKLREELRVARHFCKVEKLIAGKKRNAARLGTREWRMKHEIVLSFRGSRASFPGALLSR
jgi:hypothetical protein